MQGRSGSSKNQRRRGLLRALSLPSLRLLGWRASLAWLLGPSGPAGAADAPGAESVDTSLPPAFDWNATGFALHTEAQITAMLGLPGVPRSGPEVQLSAPEIAEDGAVVPVEVRSTLVDVRRIVLVVPANPNALVADFRFGKRASPLLGTRIKLAGSCEVIALVETGAGWWRAQQQVKVTLGGCGG